MNSEASSEQILTFFENVPKYYGSKTEISQGIVADLLELHPHLTTWNLYEFVLARSAYRKIGNKFMLEGKGLYFEMDAEKITSFKPLGRHHFEIVEQFGETVFRVTKIKFSYKY